MDSSFRYRCTPSGLRLPEKRSPALDEALEAALMAVDICKERLVGVQPAMQTLPVSDDFIVLPHFCHTRTDDGGAPRFGVPSGESLSRRWRDFQGPAAAIGAMTWLAIRSNSWRR